jgi:hypothetical protein
VAALQVEEVEAVDGLQVLLEWRDKAGREHGDPVLESFSVSDCDLALGEVDVLDPQAEALHEAEAAPIEELGHELIGGGEAADHLACLVLGEDGGEVVGASCADGLGGGLEIAVEDIAIQEEQGAEGLVLGGSGDVLVGGEVREEGFDLGRVHILRVPLVVEQDEAPDPVKVGLLGAQGIVLASEGLLDLAEERRGLGVHGRPFWAVDSGV